MPLDILANLDDLDIWSNLEGLDVYGSIDDLNLYIRFVDANSSIEIASSAQPTRVKEMSASVGALGFSTARAIAFNIRSGFAAIEVTTSSLQPFKVARTNASTELRMYAQSSGYLRALSYTGNAHLDINTSGNNTNVRQYTTNPVISMDTDCKEMFTLDSNWTNSTDGSEVWVEQLPQNEVWKIKQEGNERWGIK